MKYSLIGKVCQELDDDLFLQIINATLINNELYVYLISVLQPVPKTLHYIRRVLPLDPFPKGRYSDLVILKARAKDDICELVGKVKLPEGLGIARRRCANHIPGMPGFQPDPPRGSHHQGLTTPHNIQRPHLSKTFWSSSKSKRLIDRIQESLRHWQSSRSRSSISSASSTVFSMAGRT